MTLMLPETRRYATGTEAPVLVATSHGTSSPAGQAAVAALVRAVAEARPELDVVEGFVDVQLPDVHSVLSGLGSRPVQIVPLLLSAGYHVHVDLAEAIGARPAAAETNVTGALGPDIRLVRLITRRLEMLDLTAQDTVILAAAGSSDTRAVADCELTARMLAAEIGLPVACGFVSAASPRLTDVVAQAKGRTPGRVVVASYLLAPGYFASLVRSCRADIVTATLLTPYERPAAELVELVLERYGI